MARKIRPQELSRLAYLQSHVPSLQREMESLQERVVDEFPVGIHEVQAVDDILVVKVFPDRSGRDVMVRMKDS